MEKHAAEGEDRVIKDTDRISSLPQSILHYILSFLSQRKAIQTSVLSKSWLHLGSTRPNFKLRESYFRGDKETFISALDKTLQRYHDQKLCIHDFHLEISEVDSESIPLLEKWIPIVVTDLGVVTFRLHIVSHRSAYFDLPPVVFEAESLEDLFLERCNISSIDKLSLKHLKTLYFHQVCIAEESFETIMSSVPLIESVSIYSCQGLRTIKVDKHHNLKEFGFDSYNWYKTYDVSSVEIDVPTLETLRIFNCSTWYHHNKHFPHVKSLHLNNVQLSTKSFGSFSCNFPCLEKLRLVYCDGFEEFKLSSSSIKHFIVEGMVEKSVKATIDAPNIVEFKYHGDIPSSISFATTSGEWKSMISVWSDVDIDFDASSWFLKLHEVVSALSHSEISLDLLQRRRIDLDVEEDLPPALVVQDVICICEPVVVEHLGLRLQGFHSASYVLAFVSCLFRICRPREIGMHYWYTDAVTESEREHNQVIEYLYSFFQMEIREQEMVSCWQQDLEEVILEVLNEDNDDDEDEEWYPIHATSWSECFAGFLPGQKVQPRFRLKWRDNPVASQIYI
ncbi:hypothetical protein OROMI_015675 [Orobanche minor]